MLIHQIAERYGLNRTTLSGAEVQHAIILIQTCKFEQYKYLIVGQAMLSANQELRRACTEAAPQ